VTRRRPGRTFLVRARENRAPAARELLGKVDLSKVCHRTTRAAARAFVAANDHVIQEWGGLDLESTGGEFDAINERYGLKGKRRARTLADAIWTALPSKKPYCLDRVDLDALNETAPALELGPFRLPDAAAVATLDVEREPPAPTRGRGRAVERGPGYPLTGYECETPADKKGRTYRMPCASAPAEAEPTGRVLYRPRVGGQRPRVYLDEHDPAVETEDRARELRAEARGVSGDATSFEFGELAGNPSKRRLTASRNGSTMGSMAKRDRHGRFLPKARRVARRNPRRRRRTHHARRNPMPETALLINPSRRRRRRSARRNPTRRRRSYRRNPFAGMKRRSRRRYRRNPSVFGAGFTMAHVAGAGGYGLLRNGIRRLYWQFDKDPSENSASIAKFNKHSPFIKGALFALGWAIKRWASGKWKDVGEGMMLGGIADGLASVTENLGLTPAERDAKEAQKKLENALQGAGMLVGRGGLSSVLVERERQLRAADDDELDELDPNDVFDDADELEADEDELY
jgi:hypothetical protein